MGGTFVRPRRSRAAAWLVAALALALVAAWLGSRTRDTERGEARSETAAGEPVAATSVGVSDELAGDGEAVREAADPLVEAAQPAGPPRVEGRVVRAEDEAPIEGALVELALRPDDETHATRSAADGSFAFVLDGPRTLRWLAVAAGPDHAARHMWISRSLEPGETARFDLRVVRGAVVRGRVLDVDGRTVAGATVRAWSRSAKYGAPSREASSDEAGRFEIAGIGPEIALDAVAPGLACVQGLRGTLASGTVAEGDLEIVLARAGVGTGRVVDERGAGLAAELSISASGSTSDLDGTNVAGIRRFEPVDLAARAGADGFFEIGPLPAGRRYGIRARHDGFVYVDSTISVESSPVEIRMERGGVVFGRVLGPDGEPIAGARIQAGNMESPRTTSGADGSYELGGIGGERAAVFAVAAGCAPALEDVELVPGVPRRVDFRLKRGLPLAGRVVDGQGRPIAGARVVLEGERTYERDYISDTPATLEHLADRGSARTDRAGAFRIDDLYAGEFLVRASPPDGGALRADARARTPIEDLLVQIDTAALEQVVLAGRVLDAATGEPVRAFTVTPMLRDGEGWRGQGATIEAADGRFRLAGYPPGDVQLTVSAAGYARWSTAPRELAAGEHEHAVELQPLRACALELRHRDGSPVPRASARFARPDGTEVEVEWSAQWWSNRLEVNDGAGRVAGLPAELLRVTFEVPEMEPETFDLDLRVQPQTPIVFHLGTSRESDVRVELLVAALAPDADERELAKLDEPALVERWFLRRGLEPLDSAAFLEARDASGRVLFTIEVRPEGDEWAIATGRPGHGTGSSGGGRQLPLYGGILPGATRELVVSADGRAERRFRVDPAAENAGLPRLIGLR